MKLFAHLRHWFVPHEVNNHRARGLSQNALLSYALLLLVFNLGVRQIKHIAPDILGYATDIRVEALLSDTNAKRSQAGLEPLTLNATLSQAAAVKAADMFANNYWSHNSPSGKTPWDFITGAGYQYTLAGENLAKNFDTSGAVVDAWMASASHKDNLLKSGYRDVGFAIVNGVLQGEETTLVVQMFGTTSQPQLATVPQVQAQEPQPTVVPTSLPSNAPTPVGSAPIAQITAVPTIEPTATPIAVPTRSPVVLAPVLSTVSTRPLVNVATLSRDVVLIFVGMFIGMLALDAFVVSRKRIVRLVGHNLAHILFLGSIVIGGMFMTRGTLL